MWRELRVLLEKEFLQIRRDKVILRMLFVMPMIQLIVLANAATFEVRTAKLWVVDQDGTTTSRALVDKLVASGRFDVLEISASIVPAERALLTGRAAAILTLPNGFAAALVNTRRATVQLVLDAVNGSQAGLTQGYVADIVPRFAAEQGATILWQRGSGAGSTMREVRTRGWYNAALDYRHYMVPGILVQLVTVIGTLMTALNIVREKEVGTLEQLNVTPIRPAIFVAAKLIPLWVIALVMLTIGLLLGRALFGVPFEGNPFLLYLGASLFLVGALGVGLWISTIAETQQQALFLTFSLIMVYILMSGLFTPVRAMPEAVQRIVLVNPLMHFISLMRAVMLRGAGLADVWPNLLALAGIGGAILTLAVGQYRKRTE
jgi:ABC-2 type transport system permease protein